MKGIVLVVRLNKYLLGKGVCAFLDQMFVLERFKRTNVQSGGGCEWRRHPKLSNSCAEWL